jgi:hypothetical protein
LLTSYHLLALSRDYRTPILCLRYIPATTYERRWNISLLLCYGSVSLPGMIVVS